MTQRSTNDLTELQHQLYEERFYGIPCDHVPKVVIHTFLFSVAVLAVVASRFAFSVNSLSATDFEELTVTFSSVAVELNRDDLFTKEYWSSDETESRTFVSHFVQKELITKAICPDYQPQDSYLVAAFPPQEIPLRTINQFRSTTQTASRRIAAKRQATTLAAQQVPTIEFISPRRQAADLQFAGSWQASRQLAVAPKLTVANSSYVMAVGGSPIGGSLSPPQPQSSYGALNGQQGRSQILSPLARAGAFLATNATSSRPSQPANVSSGTTQRIRQSVSSAARLTTNQVGSVFESFAGPPIGTAPPSTSAVAAAPTYQPLSTTSAAAPTQPVGMATFDGNDSGQLAQAIDVILDDFHLDGSPFEVPAGTELVFENQLSGTGVFAGGGDVINNGELSPGNSPGIIGFGGNVTFGSTSTTVIEIAGTSAIDPIEYDQITVGGNLTISSGATLEVILLDSFSLTDGLTFNVITVTGTGTNPGTFAGLSEGAMVNVTNFSGSDLFITYQGGSGNDIVLYTAPVPEPLTTMTFATAIGMLIAPRRRRR